MSAQQQPPRPDRASTPGGKPDPTARLRRWRDHVEELLEEARERGEFDNLEGAGKPLQLEKNVYAGDKALAYSLLKNNQMAPPEIERGKEIDAELARAEAILASLRRQRDALRFRLGVGYASERRAYNVLRDKTEARYAEALRAINSKVLSLNILAPSALHRRTIDVEARMRAFAEEFPRLDEV
jgi:DnaJ homolog subfamily C member 28